MSLVNPRLTLMLRNWENVAVIWIINRLIIYIDQLNAGHVQKNIFLKYCSVWTKKVHNISFIKSFEYFFCQNRLDYCSTGDIILRDFYIITLAIGLYLPLTVLSKKHQKRKWQDPKSRLSKYKWAQIFLLNLKVSVYYLQIYVLFISYALHLVFGR